MAENIKLESVVRPFQNRDISPPKLSAAPASAVNPQKTVKFEWGKAGGSPEVLTWSWSISVKNYITKQQREVLTALGIPTGQQNA